MAPGNRTTGSAGAVRQGRCNGGDVFRAVIVAHPPTGRNCNRRRDISLLGDFERAAKLWERASISTRRTRGTGLAASTYLGMAIPGGRSSFSSSRSTCCRAGDGGSLAEGREAVGDQEGAEAAGARPSPSIRPWVLRADRRTIASLASNMIHRTD